ncbi:tetratricopeptide repeat protein [Thiocapsa roseopersicina]|uniref:Tetratricopeptide repeat-containing protein n=1 Tax=Thiocapsa roseopersicina TaxID=1058 RepID=A0A1H3DUM0_THIRO|nr:tetratricopeptide repeat protein [Thiocapsa roseopersicina]SDX69818.1 Tetratricopeptide repeat-containing protein [Thiocapsa roseopersicina]
MPIRPLSSVTDHDRALGLFTNRMAERRLFTCYVQADTPPERLLFFHGDGGNGKSLLLKLLKEQSCRRLYPADWRQLQALTDDREFAEGFESIAQAVPIPCVYHDFAERGSGEDDPRGDWSGPLMLRRRLGAHGIRLPLFDFAATLFLHKQGQLSRDRIKALFPAEEADFVATLIDLLTDPEIPFVGLAVKVIGLFNKHLARDVALWRAKLGQDQERLARLQRMDVAELRLCLPSILGEDLATEMQTDGAPLRLVLLFDTHESFWGTSRHNESTESYFQRDEWLRLFFAELYRPNHGIVVAVAGREPPRWPEAVRSPIPLDCIDTRLVGHLGRADAQEYLVRALAPDAGADSGEAASLREAIVRFTEVEPGQVHPLYLGLAVDLVLRARDSGERLGPDDFATRTDATRADMGRILITRLLRYCTLEIENAVKALAAARRFDRDIFFALGRSLHFDASRADFRILTGFSFVWRETLESGPERYRIHDLLCRIFAGIAPDEIREAHAALEVLYRERAQQSSALDAEAICEAIYHVNRQDWERGYQEWLQAMERSIESARYGLGEVLVGLRPVLHLETPFAEATAAMHAGELASALSRYPAADAAFRDAVVGYDRTLDLAPDDIAAHLSKGNTFQSLGALRAALSDHAGAQDAYEDAVAAYQEVLARAPDQVAARINKGNVHARLGRLRAAVSDHAGSLCAYQDAIAAYEEAPARAPDDIAVHLNKGNALQSLGELRVTLSDQAGAQTAYQEALSEYGEVLARAPDDIAAHLNKGIALQNLGELRVTLSDHAGAQSAYQDAIAACGEVLARAPDHVGAHINKGTALRRLGELHAALSNYDEALSAYQDAVAAFGGGLARAPDHVGARMNKGNVLRRLGELRLTLRDQAGAQCAYQDAIADFEEVLARAPDYIAAHFNKGAALNRIGELRLTLSDHAGAQAAYQDAIVAYREALVRAPDDVDARMSTGTVLACLGELRAALSDHTGAQLAYQGAIAAYGEALMRAPDHVGAHMNKGNALRGFGALRASLNDHAGAQLAYQDAIAAYGEALARAPQHVLALRNKARCLTLFALLKIEQGDEDSARGLLLETEALFQAALSLAPNDDITATNASYAQELLRNCRGTA